MKTHLDCIPCFLRQTLDTCRLVGADDQTHERLLREVCTELARIDMSPPPPVMAGKIHRIIRKGVGLTDPFAAIKRESNELVLGMLDELRELIDKSDDKFDTAMRVAIGGNIIDYGTGHELTADIIRKVIRDSLAAPILGNPRGLQPAVQHAESILYLADNAGEIITDRLFIERIGAEKVTIAVRGYPILNDVTREDATIAGLTDMVKVIDNGAAVPGTALEQCSEEFRECFAHADLVIAKGQGNYETLSDVDKDIFFLLKIKCPVISRILDAPIGSLICKTTGS
ncbi:MAG: DUF89 family protein [Phycisphaerae bacterium]|nr:DUF89 family protein [Phycisphaerae bacterium]